MFGVWPDRESVAGIWAVTANRQEGPVNPETENNGRANGKRLWGSKVI